VGKRFYLYERRRLGKSSAWYVRFRKRDGSIGSPVTSGQAEKSKAEQWALEQLLAGEGNPPARSPGNPTFAEWAADWWVYDRCPYIAEKHADGYHISKNYADGRRIMLQQYLIPAIGAVPLRQLAPRHFRDLKMSLLEAGKLAPGTINRIIGTARIMLNYAVEMRELEYNPVSPVKELKETPKERGILTVEELGALFGPDALRKVWNGDLRHYGCNLLAATTGLRLGECQGLQVQYVHPEFVQVEHSWNDKYGLSAPKWDSVRLVPIPRKTAEALSALIALHRWGEPLSEDVVFWGPSRSTPMSKTAMLKQYKCTLQKIGIPESQRRSRNLVFHSYRHGFNTLIRGRVADEQLRRVTGHKTLAMTNNYDQPGIEQLRDVLKVQESLFRT
jgi:integrase